MGAIANETGLSQTFYRINDDPAAAAEAALAAWGL